MKGKIAHKVVELLVNKGDTEAYSIDEIQSRFEKECDKLFEQAMEAEKECAAFLNLSENVNMLAVFKEELYQSITELFGIISNHGLNPVRCEYEVTAKFAPFDNPHGYVDMLLEDQNHDLVIIDLKWSTRDVYEKGINNGEAYQLYMYKHAVEKQMAPKKVAWYAYYLFPKMDLYTEPAGVEPKWEQWIQQRENRLEQLSHGIIEPVVKGSDNDKYPKHIILKNIKMK
jgi:hypothetical protein